MRKKDNAGHAPLPLPLLLEGVGFKNFRKVFAMEVGQKTFFGGGGGGAHNFEVKIKTA